MKGKQNNIVIGIFVEMIFAAIVVAGGWMISVLL
jgi:hypothetical protein